jgi:hypothetical protein
LLSFQTFLKVNAFLTFIHVPSILIRIASDAVVVEDGNRTQYAPQVRILKRKSDADSTAKQGAR